MRDSYLFAEDATIQDIVEHQRHNLERALEELPGQAILARSLEELVAEIAATFRLDVPVLDRAGTVQLPNEEVDIDVSDDPRRDVWDPSEPHFVKGTALREVRGEKGSDLYS